MVDIAKLFLEYIIVFLFVYFIHYIYGKITIKKYNRKTAPVNIKYLIYKYNVDIVKFGYKQVYKNLIVADSFIIATIYLATKVVDNVYIRLLIAFILIFPVFAGVYHFIGMHYKKKENE